MTLDPQEQQLCAEVAANLARWAMATNRSRPQDVSTKSGPADFVTDLDVAIERHVRDVLGATFPDHAIIGEELGGDEPADDRPRWYVDPIDGTTNFVHGLPGYTFSLAVADDAGLAAGVVGDSSRNELYQAQRGAGTTVNGQPVHVSAATTLTGGALTTELRNCVPWPGLTELMEHLGALGCVTRILGSSALSVSCVGAGRSSGAVISHARPIDVAASVLIAREAGARIVVGEGSHPVYRGEVRLPGSILVAAAPGVAGALVELLEEASS